MPSIEQVESHVGAEDQAAMRETCRAWRQALEPAPARLQPLVRPGACCLRCHACAARHFLRSFDELGLIAVAPAPNVPPQGKPARVAAFPGATALDFGARGAGHSLSDGDLAAACLPLAGQLEELDIGGAFLLTPFGLQRVLRACTALRSLAADGSTLQDSAFAQLGEPLEALFPVEVGLEKLAAARRQPQQPLAGEPSAAAAATALQPQPQPQPQPPSPRRQQPAAAPLQLLERLSLRGCMFLRGELLGSLAAACPVLTFLDLAGCCLALE